MIENTVLVIILIITIENNNSEIVGFMSLSKTKDFYDKSEHLSIKKQKFSQNCAP